MDGPGFSHCITHNVLQYWHSTKTSRVNCPSCSVIMEEWSRFLQGSNMQKMSDSLWGPGFLFYKYQNTRIALASLHCGLLRLTKPKRDTILCRAP